MTTMDMNLNFNGDMNNIPEKRNASMRLKLAPVTENRLIAHKPKLSQSNTTTT